MKKTFTTTLFISGYFALMCALGIIASVPASVHSAAKDMARKEIIRNIPCPEFITTNSPANQVKVIVEVDVAGKVHIAEINSGNQQLKDYVINRLHDMKVSSTGNPQKFVLVINFKAA